MFTHYTLPLTTLSGLGLENEVMTHFVIGVDEIVQCPPHREGMERPLVEGDYASGDASRLTAVVPSCNHDDTNPDLGMDDVSELDTDLIIISSNNLINSVLFFYIYFVFV